VRLCVWVRVCTESMHTRKLERVRTYTYAHTRISTHAHAHAHAHTHAHVHVHAHTRTHTQHTHTHTHSTHTHTRTHAYQTRGYVSRFLYTHTYVNTHPHPPTPTYTHTGAFTHTIRLSKKMPSSSLTWKYVLSIFSDLVLMLAQDFFPTSEPTSEICAGLVREVGDWGRDPKRCTGRDWGMGSSTI